MLEGSSFSMLMSLINTSSSLSISFLAPTNQEKQPRTALLSSMYFQLKGAVRGYNSWLVGARKLIFWYVINLLSGYNILKDQPPSPNQWAETAA